MNLGLPEIVVLFCVALLVFGPKRLPELAKNVGKGIRDFKKAMAGEEENASPPSPPPQVNPPPAHQPTFAQGSAADPAEPTVEEKDVARKG